MYLCVSQSNIFSIHALNSIFIIALVSRYDGPEKDTDADRERDWGKKKNAYIISIQWRRRRYNNIFINIICHADKAIERNEKKKKAISNALLLHLIPMRMIGRVPLHNSFFNIARAKPNLFLYIFDFSKFPIQSHALFRKMYKQKTMRNARISSWNLIIVNVIFGISTLSNNNRVVGRKWQAKTNSKWNHCSFAACTAWVCFVLRRKREISRLTI